MHEQIAEKWAEQLINELRVLSDLFDCKDAGRYIQSAINEATKAQQRVVIDLERANKRLRDQLSPPTEDNEDADAVLRGRCDTGVHIKEKEVPE